MERALQKIMFIDLKKNFFSLKSSCLLILFSYQLFKVPQHVVPCHSVLEEALGRAGVWVEPLRSG